MRGLRAALPILAAIIATWWLTTASAQSNIPDGVFYRDTNDAIWLVVNGQRVAVPLWPVGYFDDGGLTDSGKWAVMNADGMIVPGDRPTWFSADFTPVLGRWARRDASINVESTGHVSVTWKVGACPAQRSDQLCDRIENGALIPGGHADLTLVGMKDDVATGFVALSNTDLFISGGVSVIQRATDLVEVRQIGRRAIQFCRPPRDPNTCD